MVCRSARSGLVCHVIVSHVIALYMRDGYPHRLRQLSVRVSLSWNRDDFGTTSSDLVPLC